MEKIQIMQSDILDLLFDGKNKSYGAYNLRRTYNNRVITSLVITFSVILLFTILYSIGVKRGDSPLLNPIISTDRTLQDFPEDKRIIPPPPPPTAQVVPLVATSKGTKPRIVKNDLVKEDLQDVKSLEKRQIGLINIDGPEFNGRITPPPSSTGTLGGGGNPGSKSSEDTATVRFVQVEAAFPGGPQAWQRYIQKAIMSRIDEFSDDDFGTCVVQFIVDKNGNVSNVQAITMKGSRLAEISVNTIKKGPDWTPARQNGRYVNAFRLQPVTLTRPY